MSGLAYGAIALEAWRFVLGLGWNDSSQTQELWTARLLAFPLGVWLVGAGALVMFGLSVNAAIIAFRRMYCVKLKLWEMSQFEKRVADVSAIAGLLGRGAVFAAIGLLLLRAALLADPNEAGDSGEALSAIARGPFGLWLLGGVAVGLIAFGAYAVVQARYRRMDM